MVKIGCAQFISNNSPDLNIKKQKNLRQALDLIKIASLNGAQILLLHELFETDYFCQVENPENFSLAQPASFAENPFLKSLSIAAKKYNIVLPISFFERDKNCFYNSVAVIDADGKSCGIYRKIHIPTGPGYQEKYYFSPGNSGIGVFDTKIGRIGVGICWDQWFPEIARAMVLEGANILLYPTSIGNEPQDNTINSKSHWQNAIKGHAAANIVPIAVSNRIGEEGQLKFYGESFICDHKGQICAKASQTNEIIYHSFDLDKIFKFRASWGLFRDRRPELYFRKFNEHEEKSDNYKNLKNSNFGKSLINSKNIDKVEQFLPPEWNFHSQTFICWPYDVSNWKNNASNIQIVFEKLIKSLIKYGGEKVTIFTIKTEENFVKKLFKDFIDVKVVVASYNDSWARDICPFFFKNNEQYLALQCEFNGYGEKFAYDQDLKFSKSIISYLNMDYFQCPLILEGGAIESNGRGIMMATKPTILGRNINFSKCEIESILTKYFKFDRFIWLKNGLVNDLDTDGHIDNFCRFVGENMVALHWPKNENDPDYKNSRKAEQKLLRKWRTFRSKLYIYKIVSPWPLLHYTENDIKTLSKNKSPLRKEQNVICASYLNFYISNKAVFVPSFDLPTDDLAAENISECFPERKIIQFDALEIIKGGGGIHCVLHEMPY